MNQSPNDQRCSSVISSLCEHKAERITLGEIADDMGYSSFAILLIIFAGPLALPLPAVGIATVMAVPILLFSIQMMLGRKAIWLPAKIKNKSFEMANVRKVFGAFIPYLEKIEKLLKPRIKFISTKAGERLIGLACSLCAISVAMPIPFSNTVPSMGIVLMSIGLLERDGVFIIAGMAIGTLGISLTTSILYFGLEAVKAALGI